MLQLQHATTRCNMLQHTWLPWPLWAAAGESTADILLQALPMIKPSAQQNNKLVFF